MLWSLVPHVPSRTVRIHRFSLATRLATVKSLPPSLPPEPDRFVVHDHDSIYSEGIARAIAS
jgi:hypothetical protein